VSQIERTRVFTCENGAMDCYGNEYEVRRGYGKSVMMKAREEMSKYERESAVHPYWEDWGKENL